MVLNSFAASLIAYWFISFAGQLLNYLMAHTFGYDSAIRYYRVIYFISPAIILQMQCKPSLVPSLSRHSS